MSCEQKSKNNIQLCNAVIYYQFCRHVRKRKVPSKAIQKGDKKSSCQNVISICLLAGLISSKLSTWASRIEKEKEKLTTIKKKVRVANDKIFQKK